MKSLAISFRYLWSRPLAALLNLLLLSLGLASITFVVLVSDQIGRAFERDLAGIDAVVGAKGSPMQLILAGVFQIDTPPGNVPLAEVRQLRANPMVGRLIPMSLGDSFRGYRIVGTSGDYITHYRADFAEGTLWTKPMQAVLGASVARTAALQMGDRFSGAHGLGGGGQDHGEHPYTVAGILAPCACVLDRLILTATESVWQVHEKAQDKDHDKDHAPAAGASASAPGADKQAEPERKLPEPGREITLALVTYKTPLAAVNFPRFVNGSTSMQAAAPAIEVSRLLRLLGVGAEVLRGLGAVLLLAAALSVFIALWNAVRERREDLAMLRMLGATPAKVAGLLLCEAWWLAVLASLLGLAGGHLAAGLAGSLLQAERSLPVTGMLWLAQEAWIPVSAVAVATVAALIPAISAYRIDVAHLLNSR